MSRIHGPACQRDELLRNPTEGIRVVPSRADGRANFTGGARLVRAAPRIAARNREPLRCRNRESVGRLVFGPPLVGLHYRLRRTNAPSHPQHCRPDQVWALLPPALEPSRITSLRFSAPRGHHILRMLGCSSPNGRHCGRPAQTSRLSTMRARYRRLLMRIRRPTEQASRLAGSSCDVHTGRCLADIGTTRASALTGGWLTTQTSEQEHTLARDCDLWTYAGVLVTA